MPDRLCSVRETAIRLGLAQVTVRLWIRESKLAHVRLGRRVLVRDSDIHRLVRCGIVPAISQAPALPQVPLDFKMSAANDF